MADRDDPNPRAWVPPGGKPTPEEIDAYMARVTRLLFGDKPPPKHERKPPPPAVQSRRKRR